MIPWKLHSLRFFLTFPGSILLRLFLLFRLFLRFSLFRHLLDTFSLHSHEARLALAFERTNQIAAILAVDITH